MSHSMKLWECEVETRLRMEVEICEQQYGFMLKKGATDAIFALRILMEKLGKGRKSYTVYLSTLRRHTIESREKNYGTV